MDPQIIQAILQRQGAGNSADNVNRIKEFAASNPDVLDRYGMGLSPGLDDNSALLRLALDKSIASTDSPAQQQPLPQAPMPQQGTGPAVPQRPPMQKPTPAWYNTSENQNLGPVPARNATPGEMGSRTTSSNPGTSASGTIPGMPGGIPRGAFTPQTGGSGLVEPPSTYGSGSMVGPDQSGGSILGLLASLGITGGALAALFGAGGKPVVPPTGNALPLNPGQLAPQVNAPQAPAPQGPVPRTPAPYSTDMPPTKPGATPPTKSDGLVPPPYATDPTSPQDKARMQGEVNAENEGIAAKEARDAKILRDQMNTRATAKAGARAVRGR